MLMGRRAAAEYNYEPACSDELMGFWCGLFARAIDYDPAEKFRLACIESYKKKRGIE